MNVRTKTSYRRRQPDNNREVEHKIQPIFHLFFDACLSGNASWVGHLGGILVIYEHDNTSSPLLCVFHRDLTSPIQYSLSLFSQLVSWLLSDGRPMSVKTANDPPRDKQSLLALYHDSWRSNFL